VYTLQPLAKGLRPCRCTAVLGAILVALVAGCASLAGPDPAERQAMRERAPELRRDLFEPLPPVPAFEQLVALSEEQERAFRRYFDARINRTARPYRRVYQYLAEELGDIRFQQHTVGAAEAIESRSANCMSLALATTAYARLAGVPLRWQLANSDPVYSREGSVVYISDHIQTRLYDADRRANVTKVSMFRPSILVDYFSEEPARAEKPLREHQMIALVYQNLGTEAIAAERYAQSFALLVRGLEHDPFNANLYNALAVLHWRVGADATAEALYRFVLDEFGDRVAVLQNYRKLLLAQGRSAAAERLKARIMTLPDPDPFPILDLGDRALGEDRLREALAYYRKAEDVAPYLPQVYNKLARVYQRMGKLAAAERALAIAVEKAPPNGDRQHYQAKLNALRLRATGPADSRMP